MTPTLPMIGPYELIELLAESRSAAVWVARAPGAVRDLVLKVRRRGDVQLDRRFLREYEAARGLAVPGVVRVLDAGIDARYLWFLMERVFGLPFDAWVACAPDLAGRVARIRAVTPALLRSLAGIHRAGFIHRDLKPANVLVDRQGIAWILDFGIVQPWAGGPGLTAEGELVGTLPFMSPEQISGAPLTPASDLFSLGLLLYEALLGPRPRLAAPLDWLRALCTERLPPPVCRDSSIPRDVSALIERLLSLDPIDRGDPEELANLLDGQEEARVEWPEPHVWGGDGMALGAGIRLLAGEGPRLLVLSGPPGSGRRRTAEQIRREAMVRGVRTVRGRCVVERPGGAVEEVLAALTAAPRDEGWRRTLGADDASLLLEMWPYLPLEPEGQVIGSASEVIAAVARALGRAAGAGPLLLVFEDLDEVDWFSVRVLERLLRLAPPCLSVVATMDRRDALRRARRLISTLAADNLVVEVEMVDLDGAEASWVASSLVPGGGLAVPPGSPLHAVEAGCLALARGRGERFGWLPAELHPAVLLPEGVHGAVLAALGVSPEAVPELLFELGEGRAESGRGRYQLGSRLLAGSTQARLGPRVRAAERLVSALRADPDPGPRARGLGRACLLAEANGLAWESAARAALDAERLGRFREARSWLLLLDELPRDRDDPTWLDLRFAVACCRVAVALASGSERARPDLVERAAAVAQGPRDQLRVLLLAGRSRAREGEATLALDSTEELLSRLRVEAPDLLGEGLCQSAELHLEKGEPRRALERVAQCEELRRGRREDVMQVSLDQARAHALCDLGRVADVRAVTDAGVRLAESLRHERGAARLRLRAGIAAYLAGDRSTAESELAAARRRLGESGERGPAAEVALAVGVLARERGDIATARYLQREVLGTARRLHARRLHAGALALCLDIAAFCGDAAAAQAAFGAWAALDRRSSAFAVSAMRWFASRSPDDALHWEQRVERGGFHEARAKLMLARILTDHGEWPAATRAASAAVTLAERFGYRELALLGAVLGARGGPPSAGELAESLASPWVDLNFEALLSDARWSLSTPEGRRVIPPPKVVASARLHQILARAKEMGAEPWVEVARRWLASAPLTERAGVVRT